MKILILYASYGGGHASAARALKEYIEANHKEHSVSMVDSIKYINKAYDKLTIDAYVQMSKKLPKLWGYTYGHADEGALGKINTSTLKLLSVKLMGLLKQESPDLIISTHPFNNQMCGRLKRRGKIDCKIVSVITDFAPHGQYLVEHEYVDTFFVAHEGMKEAIRTYNIPEEKIVVTGIPISPKFNNPVNKSEVLKELGLMDMRTFLFFAGGAEGMGRNIDLFKELLSSDLDIQIIAISGRNEETQATFNKLVEEYEKQDTVKVLGFTDKVAELMHICSLVITKPGGITTSESLACTLPIAIVNPVPGQEDSNSNFLLNNGLAIRLYPDENHIITIKDLFKYPIRIEQIKEMATIIGKPNATKDICEALLK